MAVIKKNIRIIFKIRLSSAAAQYIRHKSRTPVLLQQNTKKLYGLLNIALNQREQEVLKLRYGLCGEEETTQREIADRLGISRSYVSRIEKNALKKLRECFTE